MPTNIYIFLLRVSFVKQKSPFNQYIRGILNLTEMLTSWALSGRPSANYFRQLLSNRPICRKQLKLQQIRSAHPPVFIMYAEG